MPELWLNMYRPAGEVEEVMKIFAAHRGEPSPEMWAAVDALLALAGEPFAGWSSAEVECFCTHMRR